MTTTLPHQATDKVLLARVILHVHGRIQSCPNTAADVCQLHKEKLGTDADIADLVQRMFETGHASMFVVWAEDVLSAEVTRRVNVMDAEHPVPPVPA